MAVSSTVMAQENIQKAFDALRQSSGQEETYTNHFMERDPDTGLMEGMSDEYEFKSTDKANKHLVTAIRQAFDKDEQAAYSVSTGSHGGAENYISLAVGNGNKGVGIGEMKDSKWIYACFLDPQWSGWRRRMVQSQGASSRLMLLRRSSDRKRRVPVL